MAALRHKIELFRGLISRQYAPNPPFYVAVDITTRCNLSCIGCRFHSPEKKRSHLIETEKREIGFDLFQKLCSDLQAMGTRQIILVGGGEPLLHSDIMSMVRLARAKGLNVMLFTNGLLLDPDKRKSLIEAAPERLKVSCWTINREDYADHYPGSKPENFDLLQDNLKRFALEKSASGSSRPVLDLCYPINNKNYRRLSGIGEFAARNGCNAVTLTLMLNTSQTLDRWELDEEEYETTLTCLKKLKSELKSLKIDHNIRTLFREIRLRRKGLVNMPCYTGWISAILKIDGRVIPCQSCNLVMGDLNGSSFAEIWNGSAYREFRQITSSRSRKRELQAHCDCSACCRTMDNWKVHRLFRWFQPLVPEL